jgi:hypothetical protein
MMSFSMSVCYMLYMAVALCLNPVKVERVEVTKCETVAQPKETIAVQENDTQILHEELLFQNVAF